jgi:hypothetical protein
MDEKSDQILNHIESQRDQLGRNLDELEHKVRRTADWRNHFDSHPALMLGLALGGGMIVGSMVGGGPSKRRYRYKGSSSSSNWSGSPTRSTYESSSSLTGASALASESSMSSSWENDHHDDNSATAQQRRRAVEALDHIKAALIAFGIAKSKEFLAQALPGFQDHLDHASSTPEGREDRTSRDRSDGRTTNSESRFDRNREPVGVGSESSYARNPTELGD